MMLVTCDLKSGAQMKISCQQCNGCYELPQSVEYLIKMGLMSIDKKLVCEGCR